MGRGTVVNLYFPSAGTQVARKLQHCMPYGVSIGFDDPHSCGRCGVRGEDKKRRRSGQVVLGNAFDLVSDQRGA